MVRISDFHNTIKYEWATKTESGKNSHPQNYTKERMSESKKPQCAQVS